MGFAHKFSNEIIALSRKWNLFSNPHLFLCARRSNQCGQNLLTPLASDVRMVRTCGPFSRLPGRSGIYRLLFITIILHASAAISTQSQLISWLCNFSRDEICISPSSFELPFLALLDSVSVCPWAFYIHSGPVTAFACFLLHIAILMQSDLISGHKLLDLTVPPSRIHNGTSAHRLTGHLPT